jgi:hypothetical protein
MSEKITHFGWCFEQFDLKKGPNQATISVVLKETTTLEIVFVRVGHWKLAQK